jgi:hypothetical protein
MRSNSAVCDRLLRLLEDQRAALFRGDLQNLDAHAKTLERSMHRLMEAGCHGQDLSRLSAAAKRNAALIEAARTGLSKARDDRQGGQGTPLQTYGASGRVAAAPTRGQTLSRR